MSLEKKGGGENVEQRGTESQRDLGHPILAFTIACVLPEAHCPLTVGLCERFRHSLSYYTASPTRKQRKEPGCVWVSRRGWGERRKEYSMVYTLKPLQRHGHHVQYCCEIYWCGKGQESHHNKGCWICIQVRLHTVVSALFLSIALLF